jgi:tetratricopeptide (TPR) repeat protein
MAESRSPDELEAAHALLKSNPEKYLQNMNDRIRSDPTDAYAYYGRHFAWLRLDKPQKALDDLNKVMQLDPDQSTLFSRGKVHRQLGNYRDAIGDFDHAERLDPALWENDAMGPYYQADCHARLGNESAALACCSRLPDNFWTPGLRGAPAGDKLEISAELRRTAARARLRGT